MAQVNIVRHNPIAIFSNPTEVIITDDNGHVVRLVEPSGNVGTQYANDVGSEWFGTIENLNKGLEICGVHWSDVYKTDVCGPPLLPTATSATSAKMTSTPATGP